MIFLLSDDFYQSTSAANRVMNVFPKNYKFKIPTAKPSMENEIDVAHKKTECYNISKS